jgi:2OG-Fe(II) oxygenase superfamily
MQRFHWHTFDVNSLLPAGWQDEVLTIARHRAIRHLLVPRSVTSRESDRDTAIPSAMVCGETVKAELPWLYSLYKGLFLDLAQTCSSEPVATASNDRYGAVLNVLTADMERYECHVDSNPIEGLLYATDHPKGNGGELVVANATAACSVEEVDRDCAVIHPVAGNLVFFDARAHAHYVRRLASPLAVRISVAMNYYTPSCPEAARPLDLDQHLFGAA